MSVTVHHQIWLILAGSILARVYGLIVLDNINRKQYMVSQDQLPYGYVSFSTGLSMFVFRIF